MNRLQHESSPYLRQHAGNPVDWYPWGPEALARARDEQKPILVSIGYSTCHWCHVMERESFTDPEIADYMNHSFINIKVDREERPDLDQLYMDACQAIAGTGGWPLNVFLTPESRPFFAGTYFPPEAGPRRMSWFQALQYAAYNFYENRQAVERQADRIEGILRRAEQHMTGPGLSAPAVEDPFPADLAGRLFAKLQPRFDAQQGGFDQAPKFPNTMALEFLLHYAVLGKNEPARQHVQLTLQKMIYGGIYDQLGGGLSRYATDREWLVPHFEKMLYDNALFVKLLADAYRLSGEELFREAIEETLAFVEREMSSPEGGFYAALDADADGEEGGYYAWMWDEVKTLLGEETPWFCEYYGVSEEGNWEGLNILSRKQSPLEFARQKGIDPDYFQNWLARAKQDLFAARAQLPRPHLDDKIILSWNALMCNAYIQAYHALGNEVYKATALRNLDFLLKHFQTPEGRLLHAYGQGQARQAAFLNDYAFLIETLLEAYTLDFDTSLLDKALALAEAVIQAFFDPSDKLFFFTAPDQTDLFLRRKELYDAEMPSGTATMAGNLQRLGILYDRADLRQLAQDTLSAVVATVADDPFPFARYATALLWEIYSPAEIAVTGPDAPAQGRELLRSFLPASVIMAAVEDSVDFPLLAGRFVPGKTLFYLCEQYACQRPVETAEALIGTMRH